MRPSTKLILLTIFLLGAAGSSYAKEWRGIVPLRSTRADVIRLLDQCSDHKEACRFKLSTEDVYILFSSGLRAEDRRCPITLPPETVIFIAVKPRVELKLAALRLDKRTLQPFNPEAPLKLKGYLSSDGLVVSLYKNKILQIFYIAGASEHLCANYYSQPESLVEIPIVHVPYIQGLYGPGSIKAGEILRISASSNMNETLGFDWTVTAGRIVSGQYTKQITMDTTGLAGQSITVTAEIADALGHRVTGSMVVQILSN